MIQLMLDCSQDFCAVPLVCIVAQMKHNEGRSLTYLQVTIATTMVGLVEGMLYAHRAGLDVPS